MDMALGLPANADEGALAENPSHHPNEESLKVMRDQKKYLNTTERFRSKVWNTMRVILLLDQRGIKTGKKGGNMYLGHKEKQPKYIFEIERNVFY